MDSPCWEFSPKNRNHTGKKRLSFNLGNGNTKAISLCGFYFFTGKFPESNIFSLCHNPYCVNPKHFTTDYGVAHFGEYELEGVRYKPCPRCGNILPKTRDNFYFMGNGTLTCCKACALDKVKDGRVKYWARTLIYEVKKRHSQTSIPVSIDEEFILDLYNRQGGRCYWTGLEMIPSKINKYPFQPSLDRIDNSKGYTPDNVVLCCLSMNMGRNSVSMEIFEEFLLKIKETGISTRLWK